MSALLHLVPVPRSPSQYESTTIPQRGRLERFFDPVRLSDSLFSFARQTRVRSRNAFQAPQSREGHPKAYDKTIVTYFGSEPSPSASPSQISLPGISASTSNQYYIP